MLTHEELLDAIDLLKAEVAALEAELALEKTAALRLAASVGLRFDDREAVLALISPAGQRALDAYVANRVAAALEQEAVYFDTYKRWPVDVMDKWTSKEIATRIREHIAANRKAAGDSHGKK